MDLVIICNERNNNVVAVVENPDNVMSAGAVALAWAKGEGYEKFPLDCVYWECPLTTYGMVARKNTPIHELEELENAADSI